MVVRVAVLGGKESLFNVTFDPVIAEMSCCTSFVLCIFTFRWRGKAARLNAVGKALGSVAGDSTGLGMQAEWGQSPGPALLIGTGHSFLSLGWDRTRTFPGCGRICSGGVCLAQHLACCELSALLVPGLAARIACQPGEPRLAEEEVLT